MSTWGPLRREPPSDASAAAASLPALPPIVASEVVPVPLSYVSDPPLELPPLPELLVDPLDDPPPGPVSNPEPPSAGGASVVGLVLLHPEPSAVTSANAGARPRARTREERSVKSSFSRRMRILRREHAAGGELAGSSRDARSVPRRI